MLGFDDVVKAWQKAPVTAIHPLRHVSDEAYWLSGVAQAEDAAVFIPEGGTVVDFGCGDGRVAVPLAEFGFTVYAVDSSPDMLARVERHPNVTDSLHTVLSDGTTDLVKLIGPVDTVVCRAVLIHHDHAGVEKLVNLFSKLLKPGGHLIADWPTGPDYVRQNWTDVTTWLPEHRLQVATSAGFELVEDDTPTVWRRCR